MPGLSLFTGLFPDNAGDELPVFNMELLALFAKYRVHGGRRVFRSKSQQCSFHVEVRYFRVKLHGEDVWILFMCNSLDYFAII